MKKLVFLAVCLASFVIILFSACELPVTSFDETLLIGKWQRPSTLTDGEDCYLYEVDYTGATWDTGDGLESDAQPFTWSVEGATMTHIHLGELGEKVPKVYTLVTLNDSTLSYKDNYGVSFIFVKVK